MSLKKTAVACAVGAALLVPLTAPIHAQQAEAGLEEIIVSARRREESLQTVPLAITAFSGESLEARGIDEIGSMNAMAPNLSVQGGAGREIESSATFRVRGVPGVAVYVDGIDQTNLIGLFTMGVVEVDRIEVLRGPQGTLFGNSALGGAIQYVTRRPGDEFGGRVQAQTGSFDRRDLQASIDVPVTENFLTKFTFADMSRAGFMQSVGSGRKYGDINDQFYRADLLFTPIEALSIRYAFDKSTQDRMGGARANFEIGPKRIFTLPNGTVFNTNAHAQAYQNAFGIDFSDLTASSGFPGGQLGEYETRVTHETRGLFLEMGRHSLDVGWDINDNLQLRTLVGRRNQERRLMVDFDSDSRVYFADRQDNDDIEENSYELQLIGSNGDSDQFNWVVGVYGSDRTNKARFPTYSAPTMTCDIPWVAAQPQNDRRGVTISDRANCFNNRMRALGLESQFVATPQMTAAQIATMWTQAQALNPNFNGVTASLFPSLVANNFEQISISDLETKAIFGDLTWNATEKLALTLGVRKQDDENLGTQVVTGNNIREVAPWNDVEYTLADPFGYNAINQVQGVGEYGKTTARISAQYQWRDELMTYITLSNGYQAGGTTNLPLNFLTLNAAGAATAGSFRDAYNAGVLDLPAALVRPEQTVDNYELGLKADWADGRLRSNVTYFFTDWRNMTGSTYLASIYWDLNGDGQLFETVPCAARCDRSNTYEVNYFPNLLTSAVRKAEASGLEVELTWAGGVNYQVGLNAGLLDTAFLELGQAGEGTVPAYNVGDKFAGAPDMTMNLWGQYDWSLSNDRSISARLDYTWTDDYTTFAGGPLQRTQEAFGLVNARLTYDSGANWQVVVAGTNLTDEYYSPSFFYTVSQQLWQGSVGRPREVLLGLNFTFN